VIATSAVFAEHHEGGEKKEVPAEENAEVAEEKKADISVTITGNDQMQFDKATFEVTEGQLVEIVFKNVGNLPVEAMGHNLVILNAGTDVADFAMKGMQAKETDYVSADEESQKLVVVATKVLGPGEEDQVTFTAGAAGEYPYVCTFPGHFAVMKGVMTVKAK